MRRRLSSRVLLACAGLCWVATPAIAQEADEDLAREDRIGALERKVEVLTEELERTRTDMAVPETAELKSVYGLGPGASKIYSITRGLSIGGYTEGFYSAIVDDKRESGAKNRADMLRAVLYAGYKFTDRILYNMEIEFEHATTSSTESSSGGSVSVEFAALDFLLADWANVRTGLLLVPMGFINEVHEPPFFYGVNRPEVERTIIPSTWRENGVGLFGELAEQIDYKLYVVNGFNAEGFSPSGLRGGRQQGNRVLAEHLAFIGRLDWTPLPELLLGGSVYVGNSGQDQDFTVDAGMGEFEAGLPDALTTIWEVHGQFEKRGLHLRALFTMAHIDDARDLSRVLGPEDMGGIGQLGDGEAVAKQMLGLYGEIAYDVLQWLAPSSDMTLEPFFRFEYLDTQNRMPSGYSADERRKVEIYTAGLSFKPIRNVVIKVDYRNRRPEEGALGDEINAGFGLVF
jgi:hypothetical protein